jgi:CDP-diacylglycerol--glycerol-3-phosphate 3-phosphatidyltransferase
VSGFGAGPRVPTAAGRGDGEAGTMGWMERLRPRTQALLAPVTGGLVALGVRADHVTVVGTLMSLAAAIAFFEGMFRTGAVLLAVSGVCDILDGEVARRRDVRSRFGAFLDSTLDRFADAVVLAGIAGFYLMHMVELVLQPQIAVAEIGRGLLPSTWARVSLTAVAALIGSLLVSYTRARAEGLGLECKVGWFERPHRMVLLIVAGAFGVGPLMSGALLLLVVLSFVTAGQRVAHVWKITRGAGMDA